jgi:hypothetical protein
MGNFAASAAVYDPVPVTAGRLRIGSDRSLASPKAPSSRRVWFTHESDRLVRQDSLTKGRRGACTEAQLFPGSGVVKPTGLEHSRLNGESVFLCAAHSPIQRHAPCLPAHGSAPLKSILVTSAVL